MFTGKTTLAGNVARMEIIFVKCEGNRLPWETWGKWESNIKNDLKQ
jgi:hypothetical protein